MTSTVEIFFCYAHEDEELLKGLKKHLRGLQRQGIIKIWYDREIGAGSKWKHEIDTHLNSAHIILLLVSPDFMDSDYCYSAEMEQAMARHSRGEACVIPIILRPVYWQGSPFGELQALPTDAKAVTSRHWHDLDEAFFDIVEGITKAIHELPIRANDNARRKEDREVQPLKTNPGESAPQGRVYSPISDQPVINLSVNKKMTDPVTPLALGSRLQGGRYVIKQILGQGDIGAALLANDLRLDNKLTIIKELPMRSDDPWAMDEDKRNFKRELTVLAHLDHPLMPNLTDYFEENSRFFMAQEYIEGENLEDHLDLLKQPMAEDEALSYAVDILDVLDYLSLQTPPIVHRDIKPANIVIGARDKRAHLVDFSVALAERIRNDRRYQDSALGTPGYAAPEQYQGNSDPRSDLYALGAALYHLLTNRDPRNYPPFNFPPARSLNPKLSSSVEMLLARALENNINKRYQNAAAMKADVDKIITRICPRCSQVNKRRVRFCTRCGGLLPGI